MTTTPTPHTESFAQRAEATFQVVSWSEELICDIDGTGTRATPEMYYPDRGINRARVRYAWSGDLEGSSEVDYLISYTGGAAPTLGFQRFIGSLAGHDGSFVCVQTGEHDAEGVREHLRIVQGLGTGALASLRGEAHLTLAGHSDDGYHLVLAYDLA
jgi:hypothetical protein